MSPQAVAALISLLSLLITEEPTIVSEIQALFAAKGATLPPLTPTVTTDMAPVLAAVEKK